MYGIKGLADQEIDLKGALLYPGFVDSHMHMIGHGDKLLESRFSESRISG